MVDPINLANFDHITFHFDGNNNDKDDIAALPIAATLTVAAGLTDKTTFFYGNNLSEPNSTYQVEAMHKSGAFAEKLGIDSYSYQDGIQQTTGELVKILDSGKTVLAIEGGPMEAIYRALEQTSPVNRDNVTLLSHSSWNENRDKGTRPGGGKPRTWSDLRNDFPEVKQIDIRDQNNGSNNDVGFNSFEWDWLDSTSNPVLQEARELMQNAQGKVNDPSDAGMLFYAITGQEEADPDDAKAYFDANPPTFATASQPSPEPAPEPIPPASGDDSYLASDGQVVIEAESADLQGSWKSVEVDGKQAVLWDAAKSSYGKVPEGQTLSYTFETDEAGDYSIAMHSGRVKSAMNDSDRYENGQERTDTGNDAYVSIVNAETGEVVKAPTKLFTGLGSSDQELRWGTTFDANHKKFPAQVTLDANTQYRLEISGRSDGYVLNRITLSNDGFLKDADRPESPKGSSPVPTPEPAPTPEPEPVPDSAFDGPLLTFSVINPDTDEVVEGFEGLSNSGEIDLKGLDLEQYTLVATVNPDHPNADSVKSVRFESGAGNRTESVKPYALFGDKDGDFNGQVMETGDYTVKAIAYSGERASGSALGSTQFDYTVIDTTATSKSVGEPEPDPAPSPAPDSAPSAPSAIQIEAEDMQLSGAYRIEAIDAASGGGVISLRNGGNADTGSATVEFSGSSGTYDISMAYFDENDGVGRLTLEKGGETLADITLDQELGSRLADANTLTTHEIKGVKLTQGDRLTLMGVEDGSPTTAEHARVDFIEFRPAADVTTVVGGDQNKGADVLSGGMGESPAESDDAGMPTLVEASADGGFDGTDGRDLFQIGGDIVATIRDFQVGDDQILIGSGQGMDSLSILQVGDNALVGDRATGAVFAQLNGVKAQSLISSAEETFQTAA